MVEERVSFPAIEHEVIGDAFAKFWEEAGGISSISPIHANNIKAILDEERVSGQSSDGTKLAKYFDEQISPDIPDKKNREKRYAAMTAIFTLIDSIPGRRELLLNAIKESSLNSPHFVTMPFLMGTESVPSDLENGSLWEQWRKELPQHASSLSVLETVMRETRGASLDERGNNVRDLECFKGVMYGGIQTMYQLIRAMSIPLNVEREKERFARFYGIETDSKECVKKMQECVMSSLRRMYPLAGLSLDFSRNLHGTSQFFLYEVDDRKDPAVGSTRLLLSNTILERALNEIKKGEDVHSTAYDLGLENLRGKSIDARKAIGCPAMLTPVFLPIAKVLIEKVIV